MRVICPNCKGKGEVRIHPYWPLYMLSLGAAYLIDSAAPETESCNPCEGKGFWTESANPKEKE